jgi:hypothetical protein
MHGAASMRSAQLTQQWTPLLKLCEHGHRMHVQQHAMSPTHIIQHHPHPPTSRWEGRPVSPPFSWDEQTAAEAIVPHDAWLKQLDLRKEGLAVLQDRPGAVLQVRHGGVTVTTLHGTQAQEVFKEQHAEDPSSWQHLLVAALQRRLRVRPAALSLHPTPSRPCLLQEEQQSTDPAAAAADLAAVKQLLVDNAGLLQMLLLVHTCNDSSTPTAALCRMAMPQFRAMLTAAQVRGGGGSGRGNAAWPCCSSGPC